MATPRISAIKSLNDSTDRWKIVARVLRRWNVHQKDAPNDVFCIAMLLADEEGCKIQASVMNKALFDKYNDTPVEGRTYFFANFRVSANTKEFRATNHPFWITFGQQTYVNEVDAPIPEYSYTFVPIAQILKLTEKEPIEHLIDVIGFVTSIGSLEEFRINGETKNRIRLTLADEQENSVNCVLYDECAVNVCLTDLSKLEPPVVMVIQLGRVGFDEDGTPEICSSFYATQISFNGSSPEVKHFIDSAKSLPSPVISTITQTVPSQSANQSASSMLRAFPRIQISEIRNQSLDDYFLIHCVVVKLDTQHGWYYDGCSKCVSKPKFINGKISCYTCKKAPQSIEPKLKVHYIVLDDSGKASVVFFDKFASELIQSTAPQLKATLENVSHGHDFPDELDQLIGRRFLLKLKLNKYNLDYPNSCISVAAYTECANLMENFNEAMEEPREEIPNLPEEDPDCVMVEAENVEDPTPPEPVLADPFAKDTDNAGIDDMPVSQSVATAKYKGKRKSAWRKVEVVTEKPGSSDARSAVKPPLKPVKVIKQEKN